MTIKYHEITAQKIACKFVGSIKTNQKTRDIFAETKYSDLWRRIVKSMDVDVSKALDNKGLPHRKQLLPDDRADMQTYFYDAVINATYPNDNRRKVSPFSEISSYYIKVDKKIQLLTGNIDSMAHVDEVIFYNFPCDITLFVITMNWTDTSLNNFTQVAYLIREIEHYYKEKKLSDDFLSLYTPILQIYNLSHDTDAIILNDFTSKNIQRYINILYKANKLKTYTIVRLTPESEASLSANYSRKHLLYDVATLSQIGAVVDVNNSNKPSESYFNKLMSENLIDCFDNWTAMSLVDSFCCVMSSFDATQKDYQYKTNWGVNYFEYLYLNALYVKVFMLDANDRFTVNKYDKKLSEIIRKIDRTFNHYNVSYNFLPDMVYKKIRVGMEIDDELQAIKIQIESHENHEEHSREKKLNIMISFLTFLSITSVLNDGLGFLENVWGELWYRNFVILISIPFIITIIVMLICYINKK